MAQKTITRISLNVYPRPGGSANWSRHYLAHRVRTGYLFTGTDHQKFSILSHRPDAIEASARSTTLSWARRRVPGTQQGPEQRTLPYARVVIDEAKTKEGRNRSARRYRSIRQGRGRALTSTIRRGLAYATCTGYRCDISRDAYNVTCHDVSEIGPWRYRRPNTRPNKGEAQTKGKVLLQASVSQAQGERIRALLGHRPITRQHRHEAAASLDPVQEKNRKIFETRQANPRAWRPARSQRGLRAS